MRPYIILRDSTRAERIQNAALLAIGAALSVIVWCGVIAGLWMLIASLF